MTQSVVDIAKAQVIAYNEKTIDPKKFTTTDAFRLVPFMGRGNLGNISGQQLIQDDGRDDDADGRERADSERRPVVKATREERARPAGRQIRAGQAEPGGPLAKVLPHQPAKVVEVANDKVKSVRHYFDMGSLLRQLGVEH